MIINLWYLGFWIIALILTILISRSLYQIKKYSNLYYQAQLAKDLAFYNITDKDLK